MFSFRTLDNVSVIVCEPLERLGFPNGFSTRTGGVSPFPAEALNLGFFAKDSRENVIENRRRFLATLETPDFAIRTLWQIHTNVIRRFDEANVEDTVTQGDAIIGDRTGEFAGVFTADCQPVLLADPRTGAFAAIHAGWRGTLARIVEHAVARMREEFGSRPEDLHAALGPSASGTCYEVGDEVIEQFQKEFHYADDLFLRPEGATKRHLDVRAGNLRQLADAGLAPERVYNGEFCTMTRTDLFFSYRREKAEGPIGRLLSVIGRR